MNADLRVIERGKRLREKQERILGKKSILVRSNTIKKRISLIERSIWNKGESGLNGGCEGIKNNAKEFIDWKVIL